MTEQTDQLKSTFIQADIGFHVRRQGRLTMNLLIAKRIIKRQFSAMQGLPGQ